MGTLPHRQVHGCMCANAHTKHKQYEKITYNNDKCIKKKNQGI